jgi:hypothetical protein
MSERSARLGIFLTLLTAGGLAAAAPAGKPIDAGPASARTTIDPQPPMALSVEVTGLEKHVRGGIASIVLRVDAAVGIQSAVLTARTPGDLRFADGSQVKTWKVDLAEGGARAITVDVLVPGDGRYSIAAEIEGTTNGHAIRRGAAGALEVGRHLAPPHVREGAVEYLAVEADAGEVQP